MTALARVRSFVSALLGRRRLEREMEAEFRSHIEARTDRLIASGVAPEDAARRARIEFGDPLRWKEQGREARGLRWLHDLRSDVQYTLRQMRRAPAFTLVAVLTLTLGIGANSAIFSVVKALMLTPLPYKNSDRLVQIVENVPAAETPNHRPYRFPGLSLIEARELHARSHSLSHITLYAPLSMTMTGRDEAVRLTGARVMYSAFDMLGADPILGRIPDETDDVVVLSYAAWERYFNRSPAIVGEFVTFGWLAPGGPGDPREKAYRVVAVMPEWFAFPDAHTQFWIPIVAPNNTWALSMARLADGVTLQSASKEIGLILPTINGRPPAVNGSSREGRFELAPARDELVRPVGRAIVALSVAVWFVLLIACVNVMNLLLARTAARQQEIAVRVALGAGRGRLVRHFLAESVVLAALGGVGGAVLALGGVRLLKLLGTTLERWDISEGLTFPRIAEVHVDPAVLAFTAAIALATGIVFGLAPALRFSRRTQMDALRESAASCGVGLLGRQRLRGALVVAEIAMAMMLMVGAGLLIRSFAKLSSVEPGYDAANVLTFQVALPADRYQVSHLVSYAEDLVARLQVVPGVGAAAYAHQLPMVQLRQGRDFRKTPAKSTDFDRFPEDCRLVSRDYLRAMGARLSAGRLFDERDAAGRPQTVIVNQALARADFPGEDALGKLVYIGDSDRPWQIVGIVENMHQFGLDAAPEPQYFVDFRQWVADSPIFDVPQYFAIRASGDPAPIVSAARRLVRELDPQASITNIDSMAAILATSMARPRMYAVVTGVFAAVAVVLAAIGIYGVLAYSVAQRTREIGVRMALGAARADVVRLVLRESLTLTLAGIAAGLAGGRVLSRYLESLLYGVAPFDRTTLVAAAIGFAAVAAVAAFVPARRASNVDPLIALRAE